MSFVEVFDNKMSVHLPVKENSLSTPTIRAYFPNVSGLTFLNDNNKRCGLSLVNDRFELMPGISKYEVHSSNILKEYNVNDNKRKRIHNIMNVIDGKSSEKSTSVENWDYEVPAKKVTKIISVGWKHKANPQERCYKQKTGELGGIQKIELDTSKEYTFEELKDMSIAVMRNEFNENTLKNSIIKLATNDEEVFENFTNLNGKKCKFWEFVNKKLKLKNSQFRLFLLSTARNKNDIINSVKSQQVPTASVQLTSTIPSSKTGCRSKIHYSIGQKGSSVISLGRKNSVATASNKTASQPANVSRPLVQSSTCEGEEEFKVPTIEENALKFTGNILGKGAFGCVKLAIWNGSEVAVKCLNGNDNIKYLIREIKTMDLIRHPNIISIMGVCFTDLHVYIVMEYFKSRTLTTYISNVSTTLDYLIKKNRNYYISLQVCKAVAYMHGLNPSILHKDIKPDNILIDQNLLVKICDLGLSKVTDLPSSLNTTIGQNFHGTPAYMPPEILIHNEPGTTHSDVWSMACCFVELFSEQKVWEVLPRFTIPNLRNTILKLKKPTALENVPLTIREQISQCFEHEPSARPNALMLLQLFRRFYKESSDGNK